MEVIKEIEQLSEQGEAWELRKMLGNGYNKEVKRVAEAYLNLAGAMYVFNISMKAIEKDKEGNTRINASNLRTLKSIAHDGLLLGNYASGIAELILKKVGAGLNGKLKEELMEMREKWKGIIKGEVKKEIERTEIKLKA